MKQVTQRTLALALALLLLAAFCSLTVFSTDQAAGLSGNPLIADQAGLLSESEVQTLENRARSISLAHGCEVIILTVNGTDGKTPELYAEDYFVDHNYGFGTEHSGIMLLLDMEARDWHIATRGSAIDAFHDDPTDFLVSRFLPDLSKGAYYDAFRTYLDYAEQFLGVYDQSLSQDVVDDLNEEYSDYVNGTESKPNYVKKGILSVVLGALLGFVPVGIQKSSLKTVRKRRDAAGYARPGSLNLNVNRDVYLFSNVTSHVIQRQTTSSGGGHSISSGSSSTHTHSSGATFGGHGGKF